MPRPGDIKDGPCAVADTPRATDAMLGLMDCELAGFTTIVDKRSEPRTAAFARSG